MTTSKNNNDRNSVVSVSASTPVLLWTLSKYIRNGDIILGSLSMASFKNSCYDSFLFYYPSLIPDSTTLGWSLPFFMRKVLRYVVCQTSTKS